MKRGRKPRAEVPTTGHIKARVTDAEMAKIRKLAESEGLTIAGCIRARMGLKIL